MTSGNGADGLGRIDPEGIAAARAAAVPAIPFNPARQCHWCGSDNTAGIRGYAGERACPVCGYGGAGERDVACMFYKMATPRKAPLRVG